MAHLLQKSPVISDSFAESRLANKGIIWVFATPSTSQACHRLIGSSVPFLALWVALFPSIRVVYMCAMTASQQCLALCMNHRIPTAHCNNTLQQHTATTHCNNTLQQHTATTHCNSVPFLHLVYESPYSHEVRVEL